jgi:hypothetical protein
MCNTKRIIESIALGHEDTAENRILLAKRLRVIADALESDETDPTAVGDGYVRLCNTLMAIIGD